MKSENQKYNGAAKPSTSIENAGHVPKASSNLAGQKSRGRRGTRTPKLQGQREYNAGHKDKNKTQHSKKPAVETETPRTFSTRTKEHRAQGCDKSWTSKRGDNQERAGPVQNGEATSSYACAIHGPEKNFKQVQKEGRTARRHQKSNQLDEGKRAAGRRGTVADHWLRPNPAEQACGSYTAKEAEGESDDKENGAQPTAPRAVENEDGGSLLISA